jgi:hypothetical protein
MVGECVDELDRGLRGVRDGLDALVSRLGLAERAVPAELRRLDGALREVPVALRTRRFGDDGWTLTLAEIAGADTAIGVPRGTLAPVLGIDLVALQGALALIAVDLAPTDEAVWTAEAAPALARLHRATEGLVVARRMPEFAAEVFSPRALLAGARRGDEAAVLAAVARFVAGLAGSFAAARCGEPARVAAADDRRRRWCLAERRNRREHDALARMFGAEAAGAYLEFLFPAA